MFQDENNQEKLNTKPKSEKIVNFRGSTTSSRLGVEETELNFDLGDFEADFDVPQVDLNVAKI